MRREFLCRARSLFYLEEMKNRLAPDREHSARQPSIDDEGPMEWYGEKFLRHTETVSPFVEGDLHEFEHGSRDQQKERPGKSFLAAVDRGDPKAPVQRRAQSERYRHREEKVEHRDVRGRKCRIAHHRLMPRAVPVRPEARFEINREAGNSDNSPQHHDAPNLFSGRHRFAQEAAAGAHQPSVPNAGKGPDAEQFSPKESAVVK